MNDVLQRVEEIERRIRANHALRSAVTGGLGLIKAPVHDDLEWACQQVRRLAEERDKWQHAAKHAKEAQG